MTTLNLTANGKPQELILAYLQETASDVLAEKINNGTPLIKDGKQLVNKKTLDGFMKYATDEAKKLAEKGANSACVEDSVVYGWAIHYFEEESIEGKLYNPDGTEYKPPKPVAKTKPVTPVKVEPPKPKQQQASLWDMIEQADKKTDAAQADENEEIADQTDDHEVIEHASDDPTIDEIADKLQRAIDEKNGVKPEPPQKEYPPYFEEYRDLKENYTDSIILVRLGDFYEAFDGDAEVLADELNLTLTGKSVTADERVPMVGFPYHVADKYIAKIRAKHSVVIIESNGDVVSLAKTAAPICKDDIPDDNIEDEEIEELSETEMRQFDGDIQEPKTIDDTDDEPETALPYSPSSFDKETMIYLYDLLDGKVDIA
ncbi:MAG: Cas9 inhibitor AcrIIA9 family protein [Clostridia bacterium]|nr:Cas9 inhibitor AcrIIA9 family protein [Clostridia bacterium]